MTVICSGGGGGAQTEVGGGDATRGLGGTGAGNGDEYDPAGQVYYVTNATAYGCGGGGGAVSGTSRAGYQGIVIIKYAA